MLKSARNNHNSQQNSVGLTNDLYTVSKTK